MCEAWVYSSCCTFIHIANYVEIKFKKEEECIASSRTHHKPPVIYFHLLLTFTVTQIEG